MTKEPAEHFHISENRPGAGTAWIRWSAHDVPNICFYGSREPGNKIPRENVPEAVQALLAAGHQNLLIEKALR